MVPDDQYLEQFGWIPIVYNDPSAKMPRYGDRVMCIGDFRRGNPIRGYRVTNFFYYNSHGFVDHIQDTDAYGLLTHWMPLETAERLLHSVYFPNDPKPPTAEEWEKINTIT